MYACTHRSVSHFYHIFYHLFVDGFPKPLILEKNVAYRQAPHEKMSLVLQYAFDGPQESLVSDSSGNSVDLVNAGDITSTIDVTYGSVAHFPGTAASSLTLTNPPGALVGASPRTLSVWIKKDDVSSTGFIFSNMTSQTLNSPGKFYLRIDPGKIDIAHGTSPHSFDAPLQAGIWFHLVVTYDGTKEVVYMDGTLLSEKTNQHRQRASRYRRNRSHDRIVLSGRQHAGF